MYLRLAAPERHANLALGQTCSHGVGDSLAKAVLGGLPNDPAIPSRQPQFLDGVLSVRR